jgi:phenylacetic acid degradation operon negative regulatory protein
MASKPATINEWIKSTLRASAPRSKSLIVTVFGDSIARFSDGLWLSELIELLKPFHVNERLVRTSSFRLIEEGWLESQRDGRRSRYVLTSFGKEQLTHAHARIYDPPPEKWDGEWTLVILSKGDHAVTERVELRRELEWEGFGLLAPNIFLHPAPDRDALDAKLAQVELSERAVVIHARDADLHNVRPLSKIVTECWSLDDVANRFQDFVKRFQSLENILVGISVQEPRSAYILQTLLIHAYRRTTLHDPRLPIEMLPPTWLGRTAYDLCRRIYAVTQEPARKFVADHLSDPRQPLDKRRRLALQGS